MAGNEIDSDAAQVYLLGKTYLANNQGQFYIRNDPIVHMAAGDRHTIIITESGRAFAFGDNSSGQLGLGHTDSVEKVSCIKSLKFGDTGEKVILAACGREASLVATNRGALYAFGSNTRSQLGNSSLDTSKNHPTPVKIEHFKRKINWKQIAMGSEHACALSDEGVVYVWGGNDDGQCGQARKFETIQEPRELRIDFPVTAISCGYYHTALVNENGDFYAFGNNEDRQLGRSMPDKFAGPVAVSMPNKVKAIACGHQHTVVLTEIGEVYTCGHGDRGQLGLGHRVLSAEHFEQVPGLPKHVVAIAAGEAHTAILSARGDMYVFGDGKHGKLGSTTYSNEFEPCLVDKFKTYNVSKVVCGGCQTIILAKKRSPGQNKSSESEEDIGNATLSVTQRPKSQARVKRNQALTDRSQTVGDSMDSTLRQVKPIGKPPNLRIESDDDRSDRELSESLKSATFNQTHTLTNGRFRPTQTSALNRTSFRGTDSDPKPLKTGALDRTARMTKDIDEPTKPTERFPPVERLPVRNTRFDRSSPPTARKQQDSDEDKSSSDEPPKSIVKKPERSSPPVRNDRRNSPVHRRRDDIESDDNTYKRPPPMKTPMSETLHRKQPIRHRQSDDEEDEEEEEEDQEEDEDDDDSQKTSSRRGKQGPPTIARRSSLPPETRSGPSTKPTRSGNQTIGSKPADGVRSSFRTPATKTLAKPTASNASTDTPKKESPPPQQPGFFARLFGSKPSQPPSPSTPAKNAATPAKPAATPAKPAATPATNTSSRTCSIM